MKKSIYFSLAVAAAMGLTACQADMDTPALENPVAPIKANTTILELKNEFENKTVQLGTKENGEHYIVHGRVISSDATGNIYKSLVIQDETAALAFSLNQNSMYNEYRIGQEVVVDLTGLYIGYYSGLQQIGWLSEPYNGEDQIGFMAFDYWLASSYYNGLPNPDFKTVSLGEQYPSDEYYCISFNDFNGLNYGTLPELQSQLVEFKNVHFQIDPGEETYGYYEVNTDRKLVDSDGNTMIVRISGYSNFYNQEMPTGTGKVRGILSYYSGSDTKWQLMLRGTGDVMISDKGTQAEPYTVDEVIGGEYKDMLGWTKGYIVGSVALGVNQVSSNDDIIFGDAAETETNLVLAASPEVRNWEECIVVQLPQNTMIRESINLLDNPEMYGKELTVYGTLGSYLGLPAVTGTPGGRYDFLIDGESPFAPLPAPDPAGAGTEDSPYNVTFAMRTDSDLSGVWIEGYVAGYIDADSKADFSDENAVFTSDDTGSGYIENNIILSGVAPFRCGVNNSIPCQIPARFRDQLSLKSNPEIFGKRIRIKCNVNAQADYWGTNAIRQITEVVVLD